MQTTQSIPARCRATLIAALLLSLGWGGSGISSAAVNEIPPALPATTTLDLGEGVTMEFVLIPSGTFMLGSPQEAGDGDESPLHQVTITRPFYLGKHEVTQTQWLRLMGTKPSNFQGPQRPVDSVSWHDCQRFLKKLQTATGRAVTLPTEAQWEYACRAGTTTPWSFGEEPARASAHAWCEANSGGTTHPVGGKQPNAWGLHDLHGNLGEWCADWYANPYPKGDATDPSGPPAGDSRVVRGGAWGDHPLNVRSAYRNANGPDGANNGIGFRCVLLPMHPLPSGAAVRDNKTPALP